MSVLIKGLDMPKNCKECPMLYDGDACYLSGMWSDGHFMLICANGTTGEYCLGQFPFHEKRVDWCPLVEVPTPHGRLIDADKMLSDESEAFMSAQLKVKDEATRLVNEVVHKKIQMLVIDTPTVIDAEADNVEK